MPTVQTMSPALETMNTIMIDDPAHLSAAEEWRAFVCGLDRTLSVFHPDRELFLFNALRGGERKPGFLAYLDKEDRLTLYNRP